MSEKLNEAQKKQDEFIKELTASKKLQDERPLFHFATPGGWCNDPNGFSQFDGKIHLFYQYHPYSTQWGPMHWGHVVSKDFLNWENEKVALAPDTPGDLHGCFSGTALESDGKHILAYTGVSSNGKVDVQNQCIAIGDGKCYEKISDKPVLTAKVIPFEINPEHFRDPKIWKKDGKFYMACVIKQQNDRGAMIMFESSDAKKWTYKGILDSSKDGLSKMWECPDVSEIDGKDVLIFSPQEMKENFNLGFHDGNNSVYITGHLDYENCKFIRENRTENNYTAAQIDYGIDFYAPETTRLSDGRTIMIAWMQAWESYITPENYAWSGMMTLPRELSIKNGRLYQKPVKEFELLKSESQRQTSEINAGEKSTLIKDESRHFELDLNLKENASGNIKVNLGDEKEQIMLGIDFEFKTIFFDRLKSATPGNISCRQAKLRTEGNLKNVKIICDTCSMEVFLNDGIQTFTNAFFFTNPTSELTVENNTSEKIGWDLWKIKKQ